MGNVNWASWEQACLWTDEILRKASRTCIGRSSLPERRLLEHMAKASRSKLFSVYWARTQAETLEVEEALLARYKGQLENDAMDARGEWGEPPYAVYISWIWRPGLGNDQEIGGLAAEHVDEVPEEPGRSRYLRTELSRGWAGAALDQ